MHKLFVEGKLISAGDFDLCWRSMDHAATVQDAVEPFIHTLSGRGIFPLERSLKILSDKSRMGYLPLDRYDVDIDLTRGFPADVCRRWCVLPFDRMSKAIMIATANPSTSKPSKTWPRSPLPDSLVPVLAERFIVQFAKGFSVNPRPRLFIHVPMSKVKSFGERIADALVEDGLLSTKQIEELLEQQKKEGARLVKLILDKAYVSEQDLAVSMGRVLNVPPINLARINIPTDIVDLLPQDTLHNHKVIPVSRLENKLFLAMADPLNVLALDDVRRITKMEIAPLIASEKSLADKLNAISAAKSGTMEDIIQDAQKRAIRGRDRHRRSHQGIKKMSIWTNWPLPARKPRSSSWRI